MRSRASVLDAAAIAIVHAGACVLVRAAGFDHVSDDDFARVTIAQTFAHAPHLDPSGTSWLPFPFWALGAAMEIFGRSLAVARGASIALASAAATLPYLALRRAGTPRVRALVATAFALLSPWSLWLGAATVPESMTASAAAAAVMALAARREGQGEGHDHARTAAGRRSYAEHVATSTRRETAALVFWGIVLMCACLSRYEAWPAAAVAAVALAWRAWQVRARTKALAFAAALAVVGPLAWMAWNAHAHDGPLHFFRRVSTFKRAIGDGSTDTLDALVFFPRLLVTTRPDVVVAVAIALAICWSRRDLWRRRSVPVAAAAAQLAFLAIGNARDGAPAHHAERALLPTIMLLAPFAMDVILDAARTMRGRPRVLLIGGNAIVVAAWLVAMRPLFAAPPGSSPADDRSAQLTRGRELQAEPHLVVEPCAFEHFALLAAYGAPERAEILPHTNAPVTPDCPRVEAR
ncbi:MAG TPA: hypothetical protein VIF62_18845 [Labilithrix sp.]